jgi:hypothetical protein
MVECGAAIVAEGLRVVVVHVSAVADGIAGHGGDFCKSAISSGGAS